jgi:hypothetical protein
MKILSPSVLRTATLCASLLLATFAQAYDIRLSEAQLQQELDARMPLTQQQGVFTLILSEPVLELPDGEQRIRIHSNARVITSFGLQSRGKLTVDGKVRYEKSDYSFYLDEPRVLSLQIEGIPPSAEPQLIQLAQQAITPALKDQPVYTLSDQDMTQAMARMMLQSVTIHDDAILLKLNAF